MPSTRDEVRPHAARMYDYLLGGRSNFAVDRASADRVLTELPWLTGEVRANRMFQARVVRWCVRRGITQFLELASGIPTVGCVHAIAQAADPAARVVYVDDDPVVVAHTAGILRDDPRSGIVAADLADPDAVLDDPVATELLDLDRPVAVLAVGALHFVPGPVDRVVDVVGGYRRRLVPGSVLALSHGRRVDPAHPHVAAAVDRLLRHYREHTGLVVHPRSTEEIRTIVAGLDLVAPGIVHIADWPAGPGPATVAPGGSHGGVAVVR